MASLNTNMECEQEKKDRKIIIRRRRRILWLRLLGLFSQMTYGLWSRLFPNDDDINFSKNELQFFNDKANQYNTLTKGNRSKNDHECLDHYFQAHFCILHGDVEAGEKHVQYGRRAANLSNKPDLFFLLFASTEARILFMKDNINELQNLLEECFQMIDRIGRSFPTFILGWLFYNKARIQTDTEDVIRYYKSAIGMFNESETLDKTFGMGHALCQLNISILRCGDRAHTIDSTDPPTPSDMKEAERNFDILKTLGILGHCKVIRILYFMAKSDYYFRTGELEDAFNSAEKAHDLALKYNCMEYEEVTRKRKELYGARLTGNMHLRNQEKIVIKHAEKVHTGDVNNITHQHSSDDGQTV